ncbi:hypothetical protein [Echinicola rosea]|nr:hypothetical protein [Echinicola rosea]
MKISYRKGRLRQHLIFGVIWSILGIIAVIYQAANVFIYGYLMAGLGYMALFLFEQNKQYLTISGGTIIKNTLPPKKIFLNDITKITKANGYFILRSKGANMKIDMDLIEYQSLVKLKDVFSKLNVEIES